MVGAGTSQKSWSLNLATPFYDLLPGTTDTFFVYTWAKDNVNNPSAAYANVESSAAYKLTFSYQSNAPTLVSGSFFPEAGSAKMNVSSVTFSLDPQGGRINFVWTAFLDDSNKYWDGHAWTGAVSDPPPFPGAVWLSTAAHPAMFFTPFTNPDGQSVLSVTFNNYADGVSSPTFIDGGKYRIYMRAQNTAGQTLLYYPPTVSTHTFIYDVSAPTMTAYSWVTGLSTMSASPTYVSSVLTASGTITDNVSDALDKRQVYLQVYDITADKYLNPGTFAKFDYSDGPTAWTLVETTSDAKAWSYDMSAVQFDAGRQVRPFAVRAGQGGQLSGRQLPGVLSIIPDGRLRHGQRGGAEVRAVFQLRQIRARSGDHAPDLSGGSDIGAVSGVG